ncbi:MAG: SNF2-related protein, partial [Planctomycetes bacterium]|nr:SNF2-related protein [Planctomycetota bacterium]
MRFHPAQRVLVRGLPWEVLRVPNPDLVEVAGVAGENFGRRARFLVPVDRPAPAEPAPLRPPGPRDRPDPARLRALLLAFEIGCSFGPDRLGALAHGRIALEPYQLEPLLRLLSLPRPRLLIADDVGLGKSAEAGLILAELERRGKASRILVVCPASLTRVWRDALASRFGIQAEVFDEEASRDLRRRLPAHLNPWLAVPRIVASVDWAKQPHVLRALSPVRWDAVVLDECHHMAARGGPPSQRARLASLLAARSEALLLLSATPHDGSPSSFASLLRLLDPALLDASGAPDPARAPRHVVRRLKTGVVLASGGRFAER